MEAEEEANSPPAAIFIGENSLGGWGTNPKEEQEAPPFSSSFWSHAGQ